MNSEKQPATPETGTTTGRLPQLDALRGIAALWVLLFHWTVRYDEIYGHPSSLPFRLPDGRHGVFLFFMISGFVILMTLDKVRSLKDFVFYRFARLYPTLWASAACTLLVVALLGLPGRDVSFVDAVVNVTMVPYQLGFQFVDQSYWSLEVELFFYALMAILIGLGQRKNLVPILVFLVLTNVAALILSETVVELPKLVKLYRLIFSLRYLHLFLFGIVCYEMTRGGRWWNYPILMLCLAVSLFEDEYSLTRTILLAMLGVLFWAGTRFRVPGLQSRLLLFVGLISYPLYLLHQNIGYAVIRTCYAAGFSGYVGVLVAALLVFPLATSVSSRIEFPVNQKLRSWYRQRFVQTK